MELPIVVVLTTLYIGNVLGADWSYTGPNGPDNWGDTYPDCSGSRQSPIKIESEDTIYDEHLDDLTFTGYSRPLQAVNFTIKNNGHGVQIDLIPKEGASLPYIKDGGLGSKYILAQFHFHWGLDDYTGSEHLLDNHPLSGEIHFVHVKEGLTVAQALEQGDGLAVLGGLIRAGNGRLAYNSAYNSLLKNVDRIRAADTSAQIDTFALSSLLPDVSRFYRYEGSLTAPPCSEAVKWTVFDDIVWVHESEMALIREARSDSGDTEIGMNYRSVFPVGSRTVYRNFIPADDVDSVGQGHRFGTSAILTASLVLMFFLFGQI